MITAYLTKEQTISSSAAAFTLHEKSCFGEKQQGKVSYMPVEVLYLLQEGKLQLLQGKKRLDYHTALAKLKKQDAKIELKAIVYADLRKRGYISKTALKFGADFRVYDKGIRPDEDHARWLVFITKSSDKVIWHEFAAKNRIAHSTKKKLLLAIVDEESSVSYYEVSWLKP